MKSFKELASKYSTFIFDIDGVIFKGGLCIPSSIDTLKYLISENKQVFAYTNRSFPTKPT